MAGLPNSAEVKLFCSQVSLAEEVPTMSGTGVVSIVPPPLLVMTARNWSPNSVVAGVVIVSVAVVAPE